MQNQILKHRTKNKPILSIITVVKDDLEGLIETAKSIDYFVNQKYLYEYIIWINSDSILLKNNVKQYIEFADIIIFGIDFGIFDAMNKSLSYVNTELILFLNSKDKFIDYFDVSLVNGPSLISVKYTDYFNREKIVKVNSDITLGFPYCHQGIILPKCNYYHDICYKFGAEYKALIDMKIPWPFPKINSGLIYYDTSGISSVKRFENDLWLSKIIYENFGLFKCFRFFIFSIFKLALKRIYDIYRYISNC